MLKGAIGVAGMERRHDFLETEPAAFEQRESVEAARINYFDVHVATLAQYAGRANDTTLPQSLLEWGITLLFDHIRGSVEAKLLQLCRTSLRNDRLGSNVHQPDERLETDFRRALTIVAYMELPRLGVLPCVPYCI